MRDGITVTALSGSTPTACGGRHPSSDAGGNACKWIVSGSPDDVAITLDTYSHALPSMQEEATQKVADRLFGAGRRRR